MRQNFALDFDDHFGAPRHGPKNAPEVCSTKRHASFRCRKAGAGDMHEDSASAILDPRNIVIAEHHDDIVESIVAPKAFRALPIRQRDRSIVIAVRRTIAPPSVSVKRAPLQNCLRHHAGTRFVIHGAQWKSPARSCTIALFLQRLDAGAAERARHAKGSEYEMSPLRRRIQCPDNKLGGCTAPLYRPSRRHGGTAHSSCLFATKAYVAPARDASLSVPMRPKKNWSPSP